LGVVNLQFNIKQQDFNQITSLNNKLGNKTN